MNDDWSTELDSEEQDALRALRRPVTGPGQIEDRIVRELGRQGLIVPAASRRWAAVRVGGVALALFITFVLGMAVGDRRARIAPPMVAPLLDAEVVPSEMMATAFHEDLGSEHPLLASDAIGCEQDRHSLLVKPASH